MIRLPLRRARRRHPYEFKAEREQASAVDFGWVAKQAVDTGRTRLVVAGAIFSLAFLVVGVRLVDLTLIRQPENPHAAVPVSHQLETRRADILDRNGIVLATTLPAASLYADPQQIHDPSDAAIRLATALPELSPEWLVEKLSADRSFVWIKRGLTPRQQYSINRLGIPGLYFRREERRVYPHGALAAHVVGFTDIDGKGLVGIERSFDEVLRGRGSPLTLSLDLRAQHVLIHELSTAMVEFHAVGAAGLIMDVSTGELLAIASLPGFDPAQPGAEPANARFNRASLGIYEMGSVFKIFTTAMALDSGVVSLADGYDTSHPIRVARYTITDFKPKNRWLSIPEIFIYSSNIGTVHLALEVGTAMQQDYLARFGLMRPAAIELPEVGEPMLPSPWREINTMTVAYGHGMAVSPLQLTSAVAAVVNGGILRPATVIKRSGGSRTAGVRVLSEETSTKMRWLLRLAVVHGTGKQADAPGYAVGGKTGTAEKLIDGNYARDAQIASFVGAFPMSEPRYVIFAMVDEPQGTERTFGYATGGWVAAPVIARVVERMATLYGIEPMQTETPPERGDPLFISATAEGHTVAFE